MEKKKNDTLAEYQTEECKKRRASKMAVYSALGIMLFQNALPLTSVYAQEHTEPATEEVTEGLEFEDELIPEEPVLAEPAAAELEDSEKEQESEETGAGSGEGSENTAGDSEAEENLSKSRTAKQIDDNQEADEQRQSRTADAVFDYEVNSGGVIIKGLTTPPADGHLIVPAKIENRDVKTIRHRAFKDSAITSVTFEKNPNLTSITFGDYMFQGSTVTSANLSGLTALQSLYTGMFSGTKLETVDLSGCTALTSIGTSVFRETSLETIDLSQNVNLTSIGNATFYDTPLTSIDLSKNTQLTSIGENTFHGTSLTSIDLSKNTQLTSIGYRTFFGTPLVKIDLSGCTALSSIGDATFMDCPNLYEVYAGTNFTQVCEAFKASERTHINSAAVIVSNPAAAVDLVIDGNTYAAVQNQMIMIKDLYADKPSGYAVTLPAEVRAIQAGLPSGIGIIWKDSNQNLVDLTQTNATAFSGTYNGETGWTNVNVINAADISLTDATVTADGQAKPLDQNRIKYNTTGYENYALPIDKIQYKRGDGAYTDEAPKVAGTYQIQLTLKAANGSTKTVELTDTYEIQARNLEVSGTDVLEGIDYIFDDTNKTLTIKTSKAMTIKNTDSAKAAEYQIIVPNGVSANLTLDGINLEISKEREGAIHIFAGGTAAITLASGSENSLRNTVYLGRGIRNANAGDNSAASLVLKGEGSLAIEAWAAYAGSGTIKNGTYQFSGDYGVTMDGQEHLTIEAGDITVIGEVRAIRAERTDTLNIAGGKIKAVCMNDNFHAIYNAMISGGTVDVESVRSGISGSQISGGEVHVTVSEKSSENQYALDRSSISGGTVTLNNKGTGFDIAGTNTITGGSVLAVNGKVEDTVTPENHQFTQLMEYVIPEAGAEVTVDSGTAFSVPANHKNPNGTKIDDKLSFFLEKGKNHHVVIKDLATQKEKTYDLIWDRTLGTAGDWRLAQVPTITTTDLPNATAGKTYSKTLAATGDGTITWKVADGSTLPAGLTLVPATGEIKGTPTTAGTYNFSIIAENEYGTSAAQAFTLEVEAAVDKTALQAVVNQANALDKDLYTSTSWITSTIEQRLSDAKVVLADDDATQAEVDDAQDALEEATGKLVYKAKDTLDDLIQDVEDNYDQNDYTQDSWNDLQDALNEAKEVADDPTSTPEQLKEAEDNLQAAIDDLVKKGDTTHLQELVEEAGKRQEDQYTPETWANLAEAKKTAEDLIATDNASEQEVKDAENKLQKALDDLKNRADFSALQKLYNEEIKAKRDEKQYTIASWKAYDDAMKAADQTLKNLNATQKQVDEAKAALEEAVAGLQKLGDKTDLNKLIDEMKKLKAEDFTKDSWTALQAALKAAKAVAEDGQATDQAVVKAQEDLGKAKNQLVNIKALKELYEKEYKKDLYTDTSWAAYQKAYDAAKIVLDNPRATQKQVNEAEKALNKAITNLETKKHAQLDQLIKDEEEKDRNEKDYTPDSWKVYEKALDDAREVLVDTNSTEKDIGEAMKTLQTAISGLKKATTSQGSGGSGGGSTTTKTYPSTSRTTTPSTSTTKSTSSSLPKTGAIISGLPMGLGAGIIAAVSAIFKRRGDKK